GQVLDRGAVGPHVLFRGEREQPRGQRRAVVRRRWQGGEMAVHSRHGGRPAMASFVICSNPTASATSTSPLWTHSRASSSAVEPVAQLLFTLTTGTPVNPMSYSARCPAADGWNTYPTAARSTCR